MKRYRWAERNDGLLTPAVLEADGRSARSQEIDRRSGRLRPIRRGVVAINGTPPSWRQAVRAAVLAGGSQVYAARETALRLLGGRRIDTGSIIVIAPARRQVRMNGVVGIRSGTIEPGDLTAVDGIRCTSALRTVIDLSGSVSDEVLGDVVDDLLRRRMLSLEALRSRANRVRPAPGRSAARLRRILAARIPGYDPGESKLEARIMLVLIEHGLPLPVQQHRVNFGPSRYRLDFAWPDRRLYLEGNGFGCHSLASDLDSDARRQNELVLDGWCPIEITWRMPDAEIGRTLRRFLAANPVR
jgi:hypothetical protein